MDLPKVSPEYRHQVALVEFITPKVLNPVNLQSTGWLWFANLEQTLLLILDDHEIIDLCKE